MYKFICYWSSLVHNNNSKLAARIYHKVHSEELSWANEVKKWMLKLDLEQYWNDQAVNSRPAFKNCLKEALIGLEIQEYYNSCTSSKTVLHEMLITATPGKRAPYLSKMYDIQNAQAIAQLRLRSHRLEIETGVGAVVKLFRTGEGDAWCVRYWRMRNVSSSPAICTIISFTTEIHP